MLVITFTRRAAGELVRQLRVLGPRVTVTAGTFHGIAYRMARQRWEDIGRVHRSWRPIVVARAGPPQQLRPPAPPGGRTGGDGGDRLGTVRDVAGGVRRAAAVRRTALPAPR